MPVPTEYFMIGRDYGQLGWGDVGDMPLTRDDVRFAVIDAFVSNIFNDQEATLDTLIIWHHAPDVGPRNITEDILREIGAMFDETHNAEDYPVAFREWADDDLKSEWSSEDWKVYQAENRE